MDKVFILLGSLAAFIGVGLGAFGAHGLRDRLSDQMLSVWQTGVQYHLLHALALILTGIIIQLYFNGAASGLVKWAGYLFFAGIILFSGSLYLLAILQISKLGMITPFGGLAFLAGWLVLAIGIMKQ